MFVNTPVPMTLIFETARARAEDEHIRGAQGAPPPPSTGTTTDGQGSWHPVETAAQRPYRPTHGVRRVPSDTVRRLWQAERRSGDQKGNGHLYRTAAAWALVYVKEPTALAGAKVGCPFTGRWESGREFHRSAPAPDCGTVLQRRFTSPFRLVSPARKLPALSCTNALVHRHRFLPHHQPQPQPRRPQVLARRLITVRRGVVPDHVQWTNVPLPSLQQQGLKVVPVVPAPLEIRPVQAGCS